ncbi:cell wall synthesis protein Wag31 [soil metagenome]
MPLTPEDVRNKRFTPVRLREGYDMGEVDQFLDEVESELKRLAAHDGSGETSDVAETAEAASSAPTVGTSETTGLDTVSTPGGTPTDVAEASLAAARLMELAGRNADEVVAEARATADTLVSEARAEALRLEEESTTKAETVQSEARERAESLDAEVSNRRRQLLADVEAERDAMASEVEHLRAFEREYRSRLKQYFSSQLAQLEGEENDAADAGPGGGTDADAAADRDADTDAEHAEDGQPPQSRLQSLLGEESDDRG